jgi:excisionase family DNA binding protein
MTLGATPDDAPVEGPCPPELHRKRYYTVQQAADLMHYSRSMVYRFISNGYLEAFNPGGVGFQRMSCCAITACMESKQFVRSS